jgi:UDP-N-acetylmuramoyl-tripeptide--D-alanyl-D-alanine ligase
VAIAELLSQRHEVLATPGSFNTPMGLCLVINEQLQRSHEVAVLEYGIRYPGDMQELVDLVRPTIAVVSALGIAHLETMGSASAIDREKGLLVEALPADGHAVLNADDARVLALRSRTQGRVWTVSATGDADIRAFDVTYSDRGMSFIVQDETGATAPFEIALLGAHNVTNVLLAVAVGRVLRTPLRALARAARRRPARPHPLALRQEGPLTIIDDAFNSNPAGAREAIDVLGRVSRGRRIVVTPGMIELGAQQDAENRAWGAYMAGRVDHVYLVGAAQTKPIYEGLLSEGFPVEAIHVVDQFQDARAALLDAAQPGDVVLYENDLPDQFNEG